MPRAPGDYLNPREQQIMEIAFQRQRITAAELEELLPGRPSNSTVRTQLRILEQRGHLTHVEEDGRFVYAPATPRASAAMAALDGVLKTFFQGSVEQAFLTLLSRREAKLSPEELARLTQIIEDAKAEDASNG
ncbi:MAG: BlaI/MecI/CopY family transcriptional regulator [Capsulimonas sp.]|uniref:BlaI/MecI/CopY family transcriptional regulator n=1 Tax=Capsulimonas sp. TaxID=2494211 RepID=UPI0032632762